jgi:vacuolar-type H+-ATPase subunit I/STV1
LRASLDSKKVLAKVKAEVTNAEKAADEVTKKATPMINSPPDEGEARDKKVGEVEEKAAEAIKKVEAARTVVNESNKAVQAYAPETKKTSQTALIELQKKTNDLAKCLQLYKSFKAQLPRLAENQKLVTEVSELLAVSTFDRPEGLLPKAEYKSLKKKVEEIQADDDLEED